MIHPTGAVNGDELFSSRIWIVSKGFGGTMISSLKRLCCSCGQEEEITNDAKERKEDFKQGRKTSILGYRKQFY